MVSDVKGSCLAFWALNVAARDPDSVLSKPAGTKNAVEATFLAESELVLSLKRAPAQFSSRSDCL